MERENAIKLVDEWIQNPNLKRHLYATAFCMEAYAEKLGEDRDKWFITGLLHDLDYEKYPDEHPERAVEFLKDKLPEDALSAIKKHAYPEEKREKNIEKYLAAIDELTGFLIAVALVMPNRSFKEIKYKSFKKKWKDKAFARGVDRTLAKRFVEEANLDMEEHVKFMIQVLAEKEEEFFK